MFSIKMLVLKFWKRNSSKDSRLAGKYIYSQYSTRRIHTKWVFWYLIISALIKYYQIIKISFAKLSLFAFQLDANLVTRFWSSVWSLLHLWWSDNFEYTSDRGSSSVNICKAIHKLGFLNPVLCLFNELYTHVFPIKM